MVLSILFVLENVEAVLVSRDSTTYAKDGNDLGSDHEGSYVDELRIADETGADFADLPYLQWNKALKVADSVGSAMAADR